MATEEIGTLVARIVADQEQFRSEMLSMTRQLESNTAKMNRALAGVNKGLGNLTAGFGLVTKVAGVFGVALSARALVQFAARTIESAAELHNLSIRLNASVESLSELQHVARVTDVDFNTFTKSLQIMARTVGDAVKNGGQAAKAFSDLGIELGIFAGLTVDQQFETLAEALSRVTDENKRLSLANDVLGRSAAEMLQSMEGGAEGVRKLRQQLRDLGGVTGTEVAKAADDAKDAIDEMAGAVGGLNNQLVALIALPIADVAKALREFLFPTRTEALNEQLEEQRARVKRLEEEIAKIEKQRGWLDRALAFVNPERAERTKQIIAKMTGDLAQARIELELLEAGAKREWKTGQGTATPAAPDALMPSGAQDAHQLAAARAHMQKVIAAQLQDRKRLITEAEQAFETWQRGRAAAEEDAQRRLEATKARNALAAQRDAQREALVRQQQRDTIELQQIGAGTGGLFGKPDEEAMERLRAQYAERLELTRQFNAATSEAERTRIQAKQDALDYEVELTRSAMDAELSIRQSVVDNVVGLLTALGAEHRGAAIAALAITKVNAIKEILWRGQQAAWLARATIPFPAGEAIAKKYEIGSKISAGLVAATGLVEAMQISHGGTTATRGTSANPVFTQTGTAGTTTTARAQQSAVEIHIGYGAFIGFDETTKRRFIEAIREAVEGRDMILFSPGSRQGQMFLGA